MFNAVTGVPRSKDREEPQSVWHHSRPGACVGHYIDDDAMSVSLLLDPLLKIYGTCVRCGEQCVANVRF